MAVSMARLGDNGPARVTLLHVLPVGSRSAHRVRGQQCLKYVLEGVEFQPVEERLVEGTSIVDAVVSEAAQGGYDVVVVGATEEPLFRNLLFGSVSHEIADRAPVTVIMVKRRSSRLHSLLRETVLEPSTGNEGQVCEEME
jgi:nucleotide-binding universal stress UspA family protein